MNFPPSARLSYLAALHLLACSVDSSGGVESAVITSFEESVRCEADPQACDADEEITLDEVKAKAQAVKK